MAKPGLSNRDQKEDGIASSGSGKCRNTNARRSGRSKLRETVDYECFLHTEEVGILPYVL